MARKMQSIIFVTKTDCDGNVIEVLYVGQGDDATHPHGSNLSKMNNGEKTSLKNIIAKLIADLEK